MKTKFVGVVQLFLDYEPVNKMMLFLREKVIFENFSILKQIKVLNIIRLIENNLENLGRINRLTYAYQPSL